MAASAQRLDLGASPPVAPDGQEVRAYELVGKSLKLEVLSWGAYVSKVITPDADGTWADVALGFDFPSDFDGYKKPGMYGGRSPWFGSVMGRYGGRIAGGTFQLNGETVQLNKNSDGINAIHGGLKGWDQYTWEERGLGLDPTTGDPYVSLGLVSPDGDEGYPASVDCTVTYSIIAGDAFGIRFDIKNLDASRSTVTNVVNHTYFNLSGAFDRPVYNHELWIDAEQYVAVDGGGVSKELRPVKGTAFDFSAPRRMGDSIDEPGEEQLAPGPGYDHDFLIKPTAAVVAEGPLSGMRLAARVTEPVTCRRLEAYSTEPAAHFYTANHVPVTKGAVGKGNVPFSFRPGFCLEMQHLPDSPNRPDFPSTELAAGATMTSRTAYRFSTVGPGECLPPTHPEKSLPRPALEQ